MKYKIAPVGVVISELDEIANNFRRELNALRKIASLEHHLERFEKIKKELIIKIKQWALGRLPSENTSALFCSDYKKGFLDCLTKAQVNIKND